MKYLKVFESFKKDIKYLLSYLEDDGFKIVVNETGTRPSVIIFKINNIKSTYLLKDAPGFKWSDVESDVLTFIYSKKDILGKIEIVYRLDNDERKLEVKELNTDSINDFEDNDIDIVRIQMHFNKKV